MARRGLDQLAILQAAIEIIDRIGFRSLTMASLAQKLNIKTPSLYNHIESLDHLRNRLALHGLIKLRDRMTDAAVGSKGEEAILEIGQCYVEFVRLHPGLYEAAMAAGPDASSDIKAAGEDIVNLLLKVLKPFNLNEVEALHTVRGLRSIVHGFSSLEQWGGGFNLTLDVNESLRHLLNTYLRGIKV
ncbi:TetR/AcrR family transcriptional regulator [Mesobacillus harenae]|uniref:TetR/AcrR family transcriptional regulator n=1 Tax=Mesobacillus harenae TaxID=2213203 RepID=UPI00158076A2|nr:TetR/AcrR family transcriptional regulator [Mesobacillus harenae]